MLAMGEVALPINLVVATPQSRVTIQPDFSAIFIAGYAMNAKQIFRTIFGFLFLVFSFSCNKAKELPLDPVIDPPQKTDVIFLGHKGGGSTNYSASYIENTMPSIIEGLKTMNGVEVDVQMSLDGTIWLFHDATIERESSDTTKKNSLILLRDSSITQLQRFSGIKKDRVYRLSELISHWNASASGYHISLEIKTDFPADTFAVVGGRQAYLNRLADALARILAVNNHPGKILIEVVDKSFCDRMRQYQSGALLKYCKMNDIPFDALVSTALSEGFSGVSCFFGDTTATAARIKAAQDSGLFVQMWTPYSFEELRSVFQRHPNVIQTDNMKAKTLLNVE